jgi:hypothetical protein
MGSGDGRGLTEGGAGAGDGKYGGGREFGYSVITRDLSKNSPEKHRDHMRARAIAKAKRRAQAKRARQTRKANRP